MTYACLEADLFSMMIIQMIPRRFADCFRIAHLGFRFSMRTARPALFSSAGQESASAGIILFPVMAALLFRQARLPPMRRAATRQRENMHYNFDIYDIAFT